MSDTPETDEIKSQIQEGWSRSTGREAFEELARRLERERDEARREAEKWRNRAFETQCEAEECPLPWEEVGDE